MRKGYLVKYAVAAAAIVAFGAVAGVGAAENPYHPTIDRSNFSSAVNHPYYPLVPGTTMIFIEKDGDENTGEEGHRDARHENRDEGDVYRRS